MDSLATKKRTPIFWIFMIIFILFYPMLISIYVFLPLLIGGMAYILVEGIESEKPYYIVVAIIYILNLEINLSLPMFLIFITSLLFYIMIYPSLLHFRHCQICRPLLSVVFLDIIYLGSLFFYDFIFQVETIVLDKILLYSLIVDMLLVVIL